MRFSPSNIDAYLFCGHAYFLREVEKRRGLRGAPMVRGTAVHASAEFNFTQKKESREDAPVTIIQDVARDSVLAQAETGLAPDPDGKTPAAQVGGIVDSAVRLAALYHREVAPHIQPVLVEEKIELEVSPDVTLVSILDVMSEDGVVADIKTAGRAKSQAEADRSLQLTMQMAAARGLFNKGLAPWPRYARLDVLVDTKAPKVQQLRTERGPEDYEALVEIVNAVAAGISAGVFLPAAPSTTWKCSNQYCAFFSECKYVGRR